MYASADRAIELSLRPDLTGVAQFVVDFGAQADGKLPSRIRALGVKPYAVAVTCRRHVDRH